jgi:hypothetical protein
MLLLAQQPLGVKTSRRRALHRRGLLDSRPGSPPVPSIKSGARLCRGRSLEAVLNSVDLQGMMVALGDAPSA